MTVDKKCHKVLPVLVTIVIIAAVCLMYIVHNNYGELLFETICEKTEYLIFVSPTAIWKKAVLTLLATLLLILYLYISEQIQYCSIQKDWLSLSIVAVIALLFFILVSPTRIIINEMAFTTIKQGRFLESLISGDLQNRFVLTSATSLLLPLALCVGTICILRCMRSPGVLSVSATICDVLCIYYLFSSMDFYQYESLDGTAIYPLNNIAIVLLSVALILLCIQDLKSTSRKSERTGKLRQGDDCDFRFIGVSLLIVCLPSLISYTLYYLGILPYYQHTALDDFDKIQSLLCIATMALMVVKSIKKRTTHYLKLIPYCVILYLCIWIRDTNAYYPLEQIITEASVLKNGAYGELPAIALGCFPCISILLYTLYLVLSQYNRRRLFIYLIMTGIIGAFTYLPAWDIPLKSGGLAGATAESISSIALINLAIEFSSPFILIICGIKRQQKE